MGTKVDVLPRKTWGASRLDLYWTDPISICTNKIHRLILIAQQRTIDDMPDQARKIFFFNPDCRAPCCTFKSMNENKKAAIITISSKESELRDIACPNPSVVESKSLHIAALTPVNKTCHSRLETTNHRPGGSDRPGERLGWFNADCRPAGMGAWFWGERRVRTCSLRIARNIGTKFTKDGISTWVTLQG